MKRYKKMKRKTFVAAILTIAICLSVMAGATFALFTSESPVDITIKGAKVKIESTLTQPQLQSITPDPAGTVTDEKGGTYKYVDCVGTFINGGTAEINPQSSLIELERVTPGDRVFFDVNTSNTSDVTIQYRYTVECVGDTILMSGLTVTIDGTAYTDLKSYTSAWKTLTTSDTSLSSSIIIELPANAGNTYQEKSTAIKITVEAVQGNAAVQGNTPVVEHING